MFQSQYIGILEGQLYTASAEFTHPLINISLLPSLLHSVFMKLFKETLFHALAALATKRSQARGMLREISEKLGLSSLWVKNEMKDVVK